MKIRRTDDPDICFMASDPVTLWTTGIVEYRVDRRDKKFLVTPVMRDGSEGPVLDVSDMYDDFLREQREYRFPLTRLEGASADMPSSCYGYGPVLLKEIARIYTEAHAKEEQQILALASEFGRDAVLAALYDVQRMRLEAFEEVFCRSSRE